MPRREIFTIDLNFQGIKNTIGVFLILYSQGGILVECGPGSTIPNLTRALKGFDLSPRDITDVFVTHVHLDHAGSAGWWSNQGANIHVHNIGAPHLINPEKLLASASRIYGEKMDELWGDFLPVPETKINRLFDYDEIVIAELNIRAIDTPGHANHHMTYLLDGTCFSGDVGGVHLRGVNAVRLPTVPPEFHIEKWRNSLNKIKEEKINQFATTHFGIHEDARWHLEAIEHSLDETEKWMERNMNADLTRDQLRNLFSTWMNKRSAEKGLTTEMISAFDMAISSQMSADGIFRYWHKFRR